LVQKCRLKEKENSGIVVSLDFLKKKEGRSMQKVRSYGKYSGSQAMSVGRELIHLGKQKG